MASNTAAAAVLSKLVALARALLDVKLGRPAPFSTKDDEYLAKTFNTYTDLAMTWRDVNDWSTVKNEDVENALQAVKVALDALTSLLRSNSTLITKQEVKKKLRDAERAVVKCL